jgi:hypothetical protein
MDKKILYYNVDFYFKTEPYKTLQGIINVGNGLKQHEANHSYYWTIDTPEHMAFLMDKENTFGFVVVKGTPVYYEGGVDQIPDEQKDRQTEKGNGLIHDAINIACEVTAACMPHLMKIEALSVTQRLEMLSGASLFCLKRHEETKNAERENLTCEERRTVIFLRAVRYFNNEHKINLIP